MSTTDRTGSITVEFCGEEFVAERGTPLTIGRTGDVEIDDNPFLHRNFLQVVEEGGLWWLTNVGTTLTATVADKKGLFQAWLNPGARIPLAVERFTVWFTAGPTTYDFDIIVDSPAFTSTGTEDLEVEDSTGETTVGRVTFTPDQKLLMVALCEGSCGAHTPPRPDPVVRGRGRRLGWKVTKFNRKLDNVCQKLADAGTRGLHGGPGKLASNRKARLVEHALSTRLVTEGDLALLDALTTRRPGRSTTRMTTARPHA